MSSDRYKVAMLDPDKLTQLLYSYSYNKTLYEKSKGSVDQIDAVFNMPSSVSYGDNFSMATFNKWVKNELDLQFAEFAKASKSGPKTCISWLDGIAKDRNRFYNNNINQQQNYANYNKMIAGQYTILLRCATTVQFAAETALTAIGVFATAPASISILAGRIVVGVASGFLISVAESWSEAASADLVVVPVSDITASTIINNTPSAVNDAVNFFGLLNNFSIMELDNQLNLLEKQIKNARVQLRGAATAAEKYVIETDLYKLKTQNTQMTTQLNQLKEGAKGTPLSTTASALGKGLTYFCWGLAIKAEYDSFQKLRKHWNGNF